MQGHDIGRSAWGAHGMEHRDGGAAQRLHEDTPLTELEPQLRGHVTECARRTMGHGTKALRSLKTCRTPTDSNMHLRPVTCYRRTTWTPTSLAKPPPLHFSQAPRKTRMELRTLATSGKESDGTPEWRCDSMFDMKLSRLYNFYVSLRAAISVDSSYQFMAMR